MPEQVDLGAHRASIRIVRYQGNGAISVTERRVELVEIRAGASAQHQQVYLSRRDR
jgi:hypothetical protein